MYPKGKFVFYKILFQQQESWSTEILLWETEEASLHRKSFKAGYANFFLNHKLQWIISSKGCNTLSTSLFSIFCDYCIFMHKDVVWVISLRTNLSRGNHQKEALVHKWLEYIYVSHDFELLALSFNKVKWIIWTGKNVNGKWLLNSRSRRNPREYTWPKITGECLYTLVAKVH